MLISACLLGARVRYHGGAAEVEHPALRRWAGEGRLVPVCPEVEGGLPTPRPPAEIQRGRGGPGPLRVETIDGRDVSSAYARGAQAAVDQARRLGIRVAILKDGSPSCGSSTVSDGTFSGTRVAGQGVTAMALGAAGVRVFSERQIDAAVEWLARLEAAG